MINQLNLFLKFYNSIEELNYKKRWVYGDTKAAEIICPRDAIVPFQIVRNGSPLTLSFLSLIDAESGGMTDLKALLEDGELTYETTENKTDYITYFGTRALKSLIPCGKYNIYAKSIFPLTELYSEVITVKDFQIFDSFRVKYDNRNLITFNDINYIKYK